MSKLVKDLSIHWSKNTIVIYSFSVCLMNLFYHHQYRKQLNPRIQGNGSYLNCTIKLLFFYLPLFSGAFKFKGIAGGYRANEATLSGISMSVAIPWSGLRRLKAEHVAEKNGTRFFYLDCVVYFVLWRCTLKSSARLKFNNSLYKNEMAY